MSDSLATVLLVIIYWLCFVFAILVVRQVCMFHYFLPVDSLASIICGIPKQLELLIMFFLIYLILSVPIRDLKFRESVFVGEKRICVEDIFIFWYFLFIVVSVEWDSLLVYSKWKGWKFKCLLSVFLHCFDSFGVVF